MTMNQSDFIEYVYDFYGPSGLYPMGATIDQIVAATQILIERHGSGVDFDSVDRERVRDILIEQFGLVWPIS